MFITLKTARFFINMISFLFAYFVIASPVGWFKASIAKYFGDDTAEKQGMLTLNPIEHVEILGILGIVLFGVGWTKAIPINLSKIAPPYKSIKAFLAIFSDVFAHIFLAVMAFVFAQEVLGGCVQCSSFVVALRYITQRFLHLNVLFFIFSSCRNLMFFFFAEYDSQSNPSIYYIFPLGSLVLLLLFGDYMYQMVVYYVAWLGSIRF